MANENGEWIMRGLDWDNPYRIRTPEELINYINQVGFLPLFANEVPGFSAEEHVSPLFWCTGDPEQDPWLWREIIARSGRVAYGKFFNRKTGFISKEWMPAFANYRRNGYDFDALWDDEMASFREKKIMDLFETEDELYSFEIKKKAGFGKEGEKNFEGVITSLQMKGYLTVRDFRKRRRKKDGKEYGWPISVYSTMEKFIGKDIIYAAYKEEPFLSCERIISRIKEEYPWAEEKDIEKVMK